MSDREEEFYNLMQTYRHTPITEQKATTQAYEAIKTFIRQHNARVRIKTISDAQKRGYLDHKTDCRKGLDSETCTCGIMKWLVR